MTVPLASFDLVSSLMAQWAYRTLLDRGEFVIYLILAIGLVISTIHLAAMLVTKWGDRRVSGKSLGFSAAVHAMIFAIGGAIYFDTPPEFVYNPEPIEQPVNIVTRSPVDGAAGVGQEGIDGQSPWTRLPDTMRGIDREAPLLDESARTRMAEIDRPDLDVGSQPRSVPEMITDRVGPSESPELAAGSTESIASPAAAEQLDTAERQSREQPIVRETTRDRSDARIAKAPLTVPSRRTERTRSPARTRSSFSPTLDLRADPLQTEETTEQPPLAKVSPIDDPSLELGPAPASVINDEDIVLQSRDAETTPTAPTRDRSRARTDSPQESRPSRPSPLVSRANRRRTTRSIPMASVPRQSEQPIEEPDIAAGGFDRSRIRPEAALPAPYRNRAVQDRLETAQKFGGSETTEEAVERALEFLAKAQSADGRWDASKYNAGTAPEASDTEQRPNTGAKADTGITGLCLLAFMAADSTPTAGKYRQSVSKGLKFLIAEQRTDRDDPLFGYLGGAGPQAGTDLIAGAYCHAIATFAMAEAVAIDGANADPRLRQALQDALQYTYYAQLPDGGWRYIPNQDKGGDMSIFGWHLMALKSASYAGVDIPRDVTDSAIRFLQERSIGPSRGLAGYRRGDRPQVPLTAEALFCRQMLGVPRDAASSQEAVRFVMQAKPSLEFTNFYYWYYGTLAMFHYGGEPWEQWNTRLREILISQQQANGTWKAADSEWGPYGGDLYSTALATLSLEVYYRYLPMYKQSGAPEKPSAGTR